MQSPMPGFAGLGDGRGTCSMVSRAARKLPSGPHLHSVVPQTAISHPVPRGRAAKEQRHQPSPSATVRTGPGQGEKSVTTAVGLGVPKHPTSLARVCGKSCHFSAKRLARVQAEGTLSQEMGKPRLTSKFSTLWAPPPLPALQNSPGKAEVWAWAQPFCQVLINVKAEV